MVFRSALGGCGGLTGGLISQAFPFFLRIWELSVPCTHWLPSEMSMLVALASLLRHTQYLLTSYKISMLALAALEFTV